MSQTGTPLEYFAGAQRCCGEYFTPDGEGPFPVVLVIHAWDGLGDEVRSKCQRLTQDGYLAFALDVHGDGTFHTDFDTVQDVLGPYQRDRAMLLERLVAGLAAAADIPGADADRIGCMGYCFGGMCALDLARSGGPGIKAAVSFHGLLGNNDLKQSPITAPVLVLNGADDPMVPLAVIDAFQQEMTAREADWQLVNYGHTLHGFTRKAANSPERGIQYNARADQRSWRAMLDLFAETL